MSSDCEQRLIERARSEPEAFRELYNRYLPRVYAYVVYRVGVAQDAEDLTAEVFLKVVAALGEFEWRHGNSFAAWIFRIAHNLVSNFQRSSRRAGTPVGCIYSSMRICQYVCSIYLTRTNKRTPQPTTEQRPCLDDGHTGSARDFDMGAGTWRKPVAKLIGRFN